MRKNLIRTWIICLSSFVAISVMAGCNLQSTVDPETQEIVDAIASNLPIEAGEFELVAVQDGPIVEDLEALRAGSVEAPLRIGLPVLESNGAVGERTWTAYHVNVRGPEIETVPDSATVQLPAETANLEATSRTFRGFPDWTDNEFFTILEDFESNQPDFDEAVYQASVLNLVGNQLEGAYFGNPEDPTVHVITSIQNILEPHVGIGEASRLAGLTEDNYVIYQQKDLQPIVDHGETAPPVEVAAQDEDIAISPQEHVQVRTLRPAMVADDTLYDPDTGTWQVRHWFDRVDAAANRQNAYLWLANIAQDIPSSASTLSTDNNRIYVRTKISRYLVLTQSGKAALTDPGQLCGDGPDYLDEVRQLSNNGNRFSNEYWMWWTRRYGGGCAYISTIHRTPFDYAVGVTGYGSGNVDSTSFVFMHESGHTLGGTHQTNAADSPETLRSHRCQVFGFWDVGPTGPSLMSYASGTRTYCFAETDPNDPTPKKNLTKVAEFLHNNLSP